MKTASLLLALGLPSLAAAHPLGNFTVNRYAALAVTARALDVLYVVDMAEIPAYQTIDALDANRNGVLDPDERAAYLGRVPRELGGGLALAVDGAPVPLAAGEARLELPPGAGGLPTLRVEIRFAAPLAAVRGTVELRDTNFAGRAGWQEIIADGADGVVLAGSSVPRHDRSAALRAYPTDALATPPQVTEARFRFAPGGVAAPAPAPAPDGARVGAGRFADRLTELVARREPLGARVVLASLMIAAALGALHALGPGHGKTIVGAYLVGSRGTTRHALLLGLVVTVTHTAGVYLLGLAVLSASHWLVPERLFPWIGAISGLLMLGIGASLATTRLQAAAAHDHHHPHDGAHTHAPPGDAVGWRGLVALGVSGGLLPCPSALVVMLGAISLGRVAFGLVLIVAFSVGLAGVLCAIGIALVHARRLLERLPVDGRLVRWVPVVSAVVILVAGAAVFGQACRELEPILRLWT
jgi:ABC-type nickel/cobalt efflux system permease component RcnA